MQPVSVAGWQGRLHRCARAALLAPALLAFATVHAQDHAQSAGDYTVRSSVVASSALPQTTLQANGFEAAPGKALLNVVVLKGQVEPRETVAARVDATMRDLMGRTHRIDMREVRENERVSYFGMFAHAPGEAMTFEIEATPQGSDKPLRLTYQDRLAR